MFQDINRVLKFLQADVIGLPVAVFGDVMLDRYYFGEVKRISPEAPVPVTRVLSEKEVLGGAANVAQNLARLGCKVYLLGVAGADENRQRLCRMLEEAGIDDSGLVTINRPTTTKLRVVGGHQQMLRLDFEETGELSLKERKTLAGSLTRLSQAGIRALLLSDYAKGVCGSQTCQQALKWSAGAGIPSVVDPKGSDWRKYSGASFITPNLKELGEAVHESLPNENGKIEKAAQRIRKRFDIENIVVTRSEKGLSLMNQREVCHIPTRAQEVFDVSGAGDTVIAVFGAAVAGGLTLTDAAQLANLAAGIAVGKLGTYAVSREEILGAIENLALSRAGLAAAAAGEED